MQKIYLIKISDEYEARSANVNMNILKQKRSLIRFHKRLISFITIVHSTTVGPNYCTKGLDKRNNSFVYTVQV